MSKKVIEPVIIEQRKHTSFELIENDNGDLGIRTIVALFTLEKEFRTTVAKAICTEYQKVIDQNAKLVEALEKVKDMQENRQKLFNHMSTEHGLTLLESEMNSIYSICIGHEEYVKYLNWLHSKPVDTKTVDAVDTTFWRRLEMFVSNIQVNDMAGEEEKQYIIHVIESKK
jgi:hypothetical protein